MRIVILNDKRLEREAIARVLQQASCTVEAVADLHAAVTSISRDAPQVFIFSWPNSGGADLLRLARGADTSGQMYVVAVLECTPGGHDISSPLDAGAHDVVRRPLVDMELIARVQMPLRLIKWARSVTKPVVFDLSKAIDVSQLGVWRNMGELVAADLAQLVGQIARPRPGWPESFARDLRGATIPMSLASDNVELRVSIMADRGTLRWLGAALLGDPNADEATANDVLRELANTGGGAVKRAALSEHVTLTTGMPSNTSAVRFQGDAVQSWTLSLDGGKACIAIVGEIRARENQRIPASSLREGMVLVHDLRSENGALLVSAGSRLTKTTAARVAQMLGTRFLVDVACAA